MTDCLRICGPFHSPSGYSHMTRAVLRAALLAGYTVEAFESDQRIDWTQYTDGRLTRELILPRGEVRLESGRFLPVMIDPIWDEVKVALDTKVPDDAPTLFIQLPPMLASYPQWTKGPRIGYTMIESTVLPNVWGRGCWGVDTVLVPSAYCAEAFAATLPGMDLRVLPIPVDDRLFCREGMRYPVPKRPGFLFVSVFSTSERKQWRKLLQAFTEEFRDEDVGLLVRPTRLPEVQEMVSWSNEAGAKVSGIRDYLTDPDLAALYRSADCYVLPAPEGYGLPFVEAAMCGLPSVGLGASGSADFLTHETGYPCVTKRERLIGHMHHLYDSDKRFPLASLEEVRYQMRRAVDDPYRAQKAAAAHAAAQQLTPAALAPRLREEVERASAKRQRRVWVLDDAKPFQERLWYLGIGAWGDVFTSIGRAKEYNDPNAGFLYYGEDAAIPRFVELQGLFNEVRHLNPLDRDDYKRIAHHAVHNRAQYNDWLHEICQREGIDPAQVVQTNVAQCEDVPVAHWHDAKLPEEIRAWAHTQQRVWGDYILLQPYSTQSCPLHLHWPHWPDLIAWLLEETEYTYVLCGIDPIQVPEHPRLVNLVRRTDSMMHVLALAEKAAGVVTTCNALSLWATMQRLPAFVLSNTVFNIKENYFHRWVDVPTNTLLYQWDTLDWACRQIQPWLAERFAGERKPEKVVRYEDVAPKAKVQA